MTQEVFIIPFENDPERFVVDLVGRSFEVKNVWNDEVQIWEFSIYNADTGTPIVVGIPLVAGADLFDQFVHEDFGGSLICISEGDQLSPPTFENLGVTSKVAFVTNG